MIDKIHLSGENGPLYVVSAEHLYPSSAGEHNVDVMMLLTQFSVNQDIVTHTPKSLSGTPTLPLI